MIPSTTLQNLTSVCFSKSKLLPSLPVKVFSPCCGAPRPRCGPWSRPGWSWCPARPLGCVQRSPPPWPEPRPSRPPCRRTPGWTRAMGEEQRGGGWTNMGWVPSSVRICFLQRRECNRDGIAGRSSKTLQRCSQNIFIATCQWYLPKVWSEIPGAIAHQLLCFFKSIYFSLKFEKRLHRPKTLIQEISWNKLFQRDRLNCFNKIQTCTASIIKYTTSNYEIGVERWVISSLEDIHPTFCQSFDLLSFIITAWVSWAGSLPDQAAALGFVGVHLPGGESQLVHQTAQTHEGFFVSFFRKTECGNRLEQWHRQDDKWQDLTWCNPKYPKISSFFWVTYSLKHFAIIVDMLTNMPALITPSHWPAAADDFRKSLQSSDICSESDIHFLQSDQKGRHCEMATQIKRYNPINI